MTEQPDVLSDADLVVLGSGMAGMTAAAYAASRGLRVVVIEKDDQTGGSAKISGGHYWTSATREHLKEECAAGDPRLLDTFFDRYPEGEQWIRSLGVTFTEQLNVLHGVGWRFDAVDYLRKCEAIVESRGGWLVLNSTVSRLLVEAGSVVGVMAHTAGDAEEVQIRVPAVLLATGGFQGDRLRLQRHLADNAWQLQLRSNPASTGDGLRLALAAGGTEAGDMASFYGHLLPSPLVEFGPKDFIRYICLFSDSGLLFNLDGERFTDESLSDHRNAQAVARQNRARAVLLIDHNVRMTRASAAVVTGFYADIDRVEEARANGARVATSDTTDGLCNIVASWGFDGSRIRTSLEDGLGGQWTPSRRRAPEFATAPYYAIEVRPAITFTEGGIRIDSAARVLRGDGTTIPGLYAAGADTGGLFNGGYGGGLAQACVFALAAVDSILSGGAA